MERTGYDGRDWRRSDGKLKTSGRMDQHKGKKLRAYRPSDREKAQEYRPNEMLRMESSYGGISLGASRKKTFTVVVHEKRASRGPGLKKDNQEIEGNQTTSISKIRGDFQTNSHSREDSAFVFRENLRETPCRIMEAIQEMMNENCQKSAEQVLPFMNRKEEIAERELLRQELRNRQEKRDARGCKIWSRRRDAYYQEQAEKEEMRRQFFRELQFAREKSRYLMKGEMEYRYTDSAYEFSEKIPGDETEEMPLNPEEDKKLQNDYKNV